MQRENFLDDLYEAVLTLKNKDECRIFFKDICTPKEMDAIAQRFVVAKMLNDNCVYKDIVEATGASTATISRVNRSLDEGLSLVLSRLDK